MLEINVKLTFKKFPNRILFQHKIKYLCPTKSFKNGNFLKSGSTLTLNLRLPDKTHTFIEHHSSKPLTESFPMI